jgi:hypothetical protein
MEDFETIAHSLGEPRRGILIALVETDKETLNTAQLRDHELVPRGSTIHHLERLMDWELVGEADQRAYHGRGGLDARIWKLTERGKSFFAEHVDAPASTFVSPEEVADLSERMSKTEDDMESMKRLLVKLAVNTGEVSKEQAEEILAN